MYFAEKPTEALGEVDINQPCGCAYVNILPGLAGGVGVGGA